MKIIAITSTTGPQSGKTTFAKSAFIRKLLGSTYKHLRFSEPIARALFRGFPELLISAGVKTYEDAKVTELLPGITGRRFMIAMGDVLRRELREDFFAVVLQKRLEMLPESTESVLIDDLRKLPELEMLKQFSESAGHKLHLFNVISPNAGQDDTELGKVLNCSEDVQFVQWHTGSDGPKFKVGGDVVG